MSIVSQPPPAPMVWFTARRGRKTNWFQSTGLDHPYVRGLIATGWTVTQGVTR